MSNAGALGSIGVGATDAAGARRMIAGPARDRYPWAQALRSRVPRSWPALSRPRMPGIDRHWPARAGLPAAELVGTLAAELNSLRRGAIEQAPGE
jgi:hypothetical protein